MKKIFLFGIIMMLLLSTACTKNDGEEITAVLDWVPNTNHTGIYVASELGYFEEEGLVVDIIQPAEGGAADLIAAGQAEFGFSYQEQVSYARTTKNPLPVKAIAAVIQHNTSGYASPVDRGIERPNDFEGKKYGGWGSPMEIATLKGVMATEDADFNQVDMVDLGSLDFLTSVKEHVDFTWIFYGWDGISAEIKGVPINFIRLQDIDENLDFYTPVIVASDDYLNENPEITRKFLRALSRGYEYAIENPEEAADLLLIQNPEIDRDLALASQAYLAKEYQGDAKKWGMMDQEIWENYGNWMYDQGLLENKLIVNEAFTNDFLPE